MRRGLSSSVRWLMTGRRRAAAPPRPCASTRRARGVTLLELMISIFILSILGWALAQLMSTGMSTWRTGEMRRGAYERAQFIFDRVARDLAALYSSSAVMAEGWAFQADTLFSEDYDGTGHEEVAFTYDNISMPEADGSRWLQPSTATGPAWIEYRFTPPIEIESAVVQPKITLARSDDNLPTCKVIVEARRDTEGFEQVAEFIGGLRHQVITPNIDISAQAAGGKEIIVRIRIVPEGGREADARLFEGKRDAVVRPAFRFACSPKTLRTAVDLVSDYRGDGSQYLVFVRSVRAGPEARGGLEEVAYFVDQQTLYRARRGTVGGSGSLFNAQFLPSAWEPVAKGIVYFGCDFPNVADEMQLYWREADSVPPRVRLVVTTIPLSGPAVRADLRAGISPTAETVPVNSTRPFVVGTASARHINIDGEWIGYSGNVDRDRFNGCVRGERGTVRAAHAKGAVAFGGETFYVDVPIPAWGYRQR